MTGYDSPTALARFKDLCVDAVDVEAAATFWSAVLGLSLRRSGSDVWLTGPSAGHAVWINQVPEEKTVKNRVHLDVHTQSLEELTAAGAVIVDPAAAGRAWAVMTDPDGQEFCAFLRDEAPEYRLYELVIDCADPEPLARWWASVLGGELESGDGDWWLSKVPGAPFEYVVFGSAPEAKTVKNRVHWDVEAPDPQRLIDAGATLLRPRGADISWHVLADPAGNEFCAFEPTADQDGPAAG
ncbi:MAG: VOC family protein [Jatrophihabitantaceae bacterium]